jgi:membrane fusion protein, copper/silver efflux system
MQETEASLDLPSNAHIARRLFFFAWVTTFAICAAQSVGCNAPPAAAAPKAGERTRRVLYYVDPMHPAYRSKKPGKAPDCGMDLTPVYASENNSDPDIHITPDQEQAIHLETETVRSLPTAGNIHTVGRVAPDEALTYRVSAGVDGWVRQVFSDRTGMRVKKGETLASFFSKDISTPQQAYIYAFESWERLKQSTSPSGDSLSVAAQQLATARDNLEFLGMDEAQIAQLRRTRHEVFDVNLTAPADGYILERHTAVGQRFAKGELLYRIADLDHVWVLAGVSTSDASLLGQVTEAQIKVEGHPPLEARVATALPEFDELGRVATLRLEVKNPNRTLAPVLVPGMLVKVDLASPARSAITVNADAVIDSGTQKRVFVAVGNGQYEPRRVETGRQDGDRVEIITGLAPGDRVVTAGVFLLDSESRMKNLADNMNSSPRLLPTSPQ